jgi:hypothetical protein
MRGARFPDCWALRLVASKLIATKLRQKLWLSQHFVVLKEAAASDRPGIAAFLPQQGEIASQMEAQFRARRLL